MNVVVVRHQPTGGLFCGPYFLLSLFMILLLSLSGKCRICIFFLSIPLYEHLDISRAITAESLPLHIASDRTGMGNNLWFPSICRKALSYAPSTAISLNFCDMNLENIFSSTKIDMEISHGLYLT